MGNQLELFDGDTAYKTDFGRIGDTLLITFGGINQGISVPRYEFLRITETLPVKRMFIRDSSQSWYQSELNGLGEGVDSIVSKIRDIQKEIQCKRIVCIGNSMGGYAALLVGNMLAVDSVVAFAPQTFLNKWLRLFYWDRRWMSQISRLHSIKTLNSSRLDLKPLLVSQQYARADIYVDFDNRLDSIHARRLEKLKNTHIHPVPGGHYNLIKMLRDSGELENILQKACLP